jgi:cation diffusion facilitator family transporter
MQISDTRHQVRRVLLVTLILNIIVALGKIIIGFVTGALAITADGFHSMMDGSSNLVGLLANRIADRPPDEDHPYGHRRYETMAALLIGALLLLTAWEIGRGALERLTGGGEAPEISPLSIAVLVFTLVVNLFVSQYEQREGQRLRSELLIADAANTGADVFVTLSVLMSMALVALLGWAWADIVAALIVCVLIARAAWKILQQTVSVLVDAAPYTPAQLTALVEQVPSVTQVIRARSRGSVDSSHIDIDIQVPRETTADHAQAIADAIRDKINGSLNGVNEVEIHFQPQSLTDPDYALRARACADALGLATHEVRVSDAAEGKVLEMHVEVPPGQTLDEAHQQVSRLERNIQANLPDVVDVITHIEPAQKPQPTPDGLLKQQSEEMMREALDLLRETYPNLYWHHLRAQPANGGFSLMMHVKLPRQISLEAAHHIAEDAELLLRGNIAGLERVTIHTEPEG